MVKRHIPWLTVSGIGILLIVVYTAGLYTPKVSPGTSGTSPAPVTGEQSEATDEYTDSSTTSATGSAFESKTPLESSEGLAEIASVVIKEVIGENALIIPPVKFLTNTGTQASVNIGDKIGENVVYLVKSGNTWNIVYRGKVPGNCTEILPLRRKHNIKPSSLECVE